MNKLMMQFIFCERMSERICERMGGSNTVKEGIKYTLMNECSLQQIN